MFDITTTNMIIMGLAAGLVFGLLLQQARVTRYQTILGQFLFKDFTVLKVMLTAIVTGAIGIWGMRAIGVDVAMHVKSATLVANILGGLIFGIGMALLGYCPGTGVAALGDGSRHAWAGLVGMIFGGGVFAFVYPSIADSLLKSGTVAVDGSNKVTFVELTGLAPWWFIAALVVIALVVFIAIEIAECKSAGHKPTGSDGHGTRTGPGDGNTPAVP